MISFIVSWVPSCTRVARLLSACIIVSSTALAAYRNFPVTCWRCVRWDCEIGSDMSNFVICCFAPYCGGEYLDGELTGFAGVGC